MCPPHLNLLSISDLLFVTLPTPQTFLPPFSGARCGNSEPFSFNSLLSLSLSSGQSPGHSNSFFAASSSGEYPFIFLTPSPSPWLHPCTLGPQRPHPDGLTRNPHLNHSPHSFHIHLPMPMEMVQKQQGHTKQSLIEPQIL